MQNVINRLLIILLIAIMVVGCSEQQAVESLPTVVEPTAAPSVAEQATALPTADATAVPTVVANSAESEPTIAPTVQSPIAEEPTSEASIIEAIEVTYFTPAQAEGPYYTVNKPEDRDNDLVVLAGAAALPDGTVLELSGTLYDAAGMPLQGMLIEIWQTDNNGIYDHPDDPSTDGRDRNFQFYGEAFTAADGTYTFRTIMPGKYEPRPTHIHFKVKADGTELLTSQMYFAGDPDLANDGIFAEGGDGVHMIVEIADGQDEAGNPILVGVRDVVLGSELPDYHADVSTIEEEVVVSAEIAAIPNTRINLNNMTEDDLLSTIPDFGSRMVREFFEYQPYISIQQFRREIGKYVDDAQVAAYERYIYVPVDVDESDAATLMQIPGVDEALAEQLMNARPYGSNQVFLDALGQSLSAEQIAVAAGYLAE